MLSYSSTLKEEVNLPRKIWPKKFNPYRRGMTPDQQESPYKAVSLCKAGSLYQAVSRYKAVESAWRDWGNARTALNECGGFPR